MLCSRCSLHRADLGQRWCRECFTLYERERRAGRRDGTVPIVKPTHKPCYGCDRVLPATAFSKNVARVDGLDHLCRTCKSVRWRGYMKSKKPGTPKWQTPWPKRSPRLPSMEHLTEAERGYIAGMLDGEGSVLLGVFDWSMTVRLHIYNTNIESLEWIKAKLGGYISPTWLGSVRRKPCYRWTATALRSRAVLLAIQPFLIIKRRHAELVSIFYDSLPAYRKLHPGRFVRGALHEPMTSIVAEFRWLNQRGPRRPFIPPPSPST